MKRKALGRGLSSLIPEVPPMTAPPVESKAAEAAPRASTPYVEIDLDRIDPNPVQPRHRFDEVELEELAASIAEHGVVQPVLVRRRGDRYQMVAGERRLRACQRAGLRKVAAVVKEIPDDRMLEVALVENIQREELDPIDEARAYRELVQNAGLSQNDLAARLGKDKSTISNSLRLLSLSDSIQTALQERTLTPGHARALLSMPDEPGRESLAKRIIKNGLSVREAERLAAGTRGARKPAPAPEPSGDPNTRAAEEQFMRALGTKVRIHRQGKGGQVEIAFHNEEELERIYEHIVEV